MKKLFSRSSLVTVLAAATILTGCENLHNNAENNETPMAAANFRHGHVEAVAYIQSRIPPSDNDSILAINLDSSRTLQSAPERVAINPATIKIANHHPDQSALYEYVELRVRFDDGGRSIYRQMSPRDFRMGDRVRLQAGHIARI